MANQSNRRSSADLFEMAAPAAAFLLEQALRRAGQSSGQPHERPDTGFHQASSARNEWKSAAGEDGLGASNLRDTAFKVGATAFTLWRASRANGAHAEPEPPRAARREHAKAKVDEDLEAPVDLLDWIHLLGGPFAQDAEPAPRGEQVAAASSGHAQGHHSLHLVETIAKVGATVMAGAIVYFVALDEDQRDELNRAVAAVGSELRSVVGEFL